MGGLSIGWLGLAPKKWNKAAHKGIKNFFMGQDEKRENVSTLRPEQEQLYQQAVNAGMGEGAGGAFGDSADYYRRLLSGGEDQAFEAPLQRQYAQDIVPGLSEQFAGMGAGGLSSSGFRNAQVQGATDLAERLGQIRANLRQAGAQGLQGIGQAGLNQYSQNMVTQQGTPGFLAQAAPAAINAAAAYFGAPPVAGAGNQVGANTSPYGASAGAASAQTKPQYTVPQPRAMPTFMNR